MKLKLPFMLAVALVAGEARAAFDYSTVINPPPGGSANFGTGSSITFGPVTKTNLTGTQNINIANVTITSTTVAPPTDSGNIPFTDTITITDPTGGATNGTITVTGAIDITRPDTGGESSSL